MAHMQSGVHREHERLHCDGCRYSASVQLATKVIDTEGKLRATLLHELCHVATWVLPPHVAKVITSMTGTVLCQYATSW